MDNKQISVVVGVIKNDKGGLLLGQRKDKTLLNADAKWELLGGKVEFGEDPETALIREIKEESGLEVKIERLLPKVVSHIWHGTDGSQTHVLLLSYECLVIGGVLHAEHFDHKIQALNFFSPEEVYTIDLLETVEDVLKLLNL